MASKKFTKAGGKYTEDAVGSIRVQVMLMHYNKGKYGPAKGNRTRTLTVKNAKVSTVTAAIEKALF